MRRKPKPSVNRCAALAVALATDEGGPLDLEAALEVLAMIGVLGERNAEGRWTVSEEPLGR